MRVETWLAACAVLIAASLAPCRAQEIGLAEAFPERGATETLTVVGADGQPVAGAVVSVTYRPNSNTVKSRELRPTDASGRTEWTVEDAGIVTLTATSPDGVSLGSLNVAVRFGGMPASGLLVMVVAGGLLFGGALLGFVLLLREPPHIPDHEPPST
jgi:hypothetical protein